MTVRPWVAPALCLSALVAWTWATPAAPRRYKVEVKTVVVQDLTVVGQGPQTQEFQNTSFVAVDTRDSADGKVATIVLDSVVAGPGSPLSADVAKGLAGTTWHGFVQANGRLTALEVASEQPLAQVVESGLQQIFAPMKPGTRAGQSWTDTTDSENSGVAIRTVTNFQTAADTYNGAKVIKLAGASSGSISGEQNTPQGSMSIAGTSTGTSQFFVGGDGILLGSNFTALQNLAITVAQLPEPIPVTVTLEGTSTLLP
jgi:hypothetical protein